MTQQAFCITLFLTDAMRVKDLAEKYNVTPEFIISEMVTLTDQKEFEYFMDLLFQRKGILPQDNVPKTI